MSDSTITAMQPAALPLENEAVPCVQNGVNVQAPAAAFGIPVVSSSAPVALADFQTWIHETTDGTTVLNVSIAGNWVPLYTIATDGTLTLAKPLTLPGDPTESSQAATKQYVDGQPAAIGALVFKGTKACDADPPYPDGNKGDFYVVSTAGKIGGSTGIQVDVGDTLLCIVTGLSGDQSGAGGNWTIGQGNIVNAVSGPAAATDGGFVLFDGTSGTLIKDSGITLDTDATMAADSDARVPSQKAVKAQIGGLPLSGDTLAQGQGWFWDNVSASFKARDCEGQNLLVNSAFDIWQENTSYTLSTSTGKSQVADFWKAAAGAMTGFPAGRTIARTAGIRNSAYGIKLARASGSSETAPFTLAQQFGARESLAFIGRSVTVSFDFKPGSTLASGLALYAVIYWGYGSNLDVFADPRTPGFSGGGSVSSLDLSGQVVSGSVARITSAPLAVSSGSITQVALGICTGTYSGTASTDDSFTIANVKLEFGNVATSYFKPDAADELRRCQTRYYKTFAQATVPADSVGLGSGEHRAPAVLAGAQAQSLGTIRFPTMLAVPTVTLFNPVLTGGTAGQAFDMTGNVNCSSTAAQNIGDGSCEIVATGDAASAAGNTFGVHAVMDARL
jgi:hypothetical protein